MTESQLQDKIRLALGADPAIVLWRNNCGAAEMKRGGWLHYGVGNPGGADLIGMFRGRFVAAEIKTVVGRISKDQHQFAGCVTSHGGEYVVLRSVDDAITWLADLHRRYP